MHEQEVGGILLLAHVLGHTGGHRHGGHAGGADQRIDLALCQHIHHVAQDQAAGGGQQEGGQAQRDNGQGLEGQEAGSGGLEAHGQAQRDGNDVDEGVLGGVGQALGNAALTEQVAQHKHTDQGGGVGNQQHHKDGHGDGEDDLLGLRHLAQLAHLDLAGLLGGQQLHQRRLDHGDQGHVGVSRNGNGRQELHRQFRSGQDGGRAVGAADDADGGGFSGLKAQHQSHQEGGKDAQLSGGAQQQGGGVGQQGAKVRHRADSHKDNRRVDGVLNALIEHPHETYSTAVRGGVIHRLVEQAGDGQVGQQHTEGDGNQQQGLEALANAHVQQHTGDNQHKSGLPVQSGKAGAGRDRGNYSSEKFHTLPLLSTDCDQQVIGVDGSTHRSGHSLDSAGHGGGHLNLHLHGLQNHEDIAGVDSLAHRALHLKDVARHGALYGSLASGGGGRSRSGRRRGSRGGGHRGGCRGRSGGGGGSRHHRNGGDVGNLEGAHGHTGLLSHGGHHHGHQLALVLSGSGGLRRGGGSGLLHGGGGGLALAVNGSHYLGDDHDDHHQDGQHHEHHQQAADGRQQSLRHGQRLKGVQNILIRISTRHSLLPP